MIKKISHHSFKITVKTVEAVFRLVVWSIVVVVSLLVLLQLGFWGTLAWANSKGGQEYAQTALGEGMKGTGYRIVLDGMSYVLPTQLYLGHVRIYQNDEEIIDIQKLKLKLGIFPLSNKTLNVSLKAQDFTIHKTNTPSSEETAPIKPIIVEGLDLPDIYFHTMDVEDISIVNLTVEGKTPLMLSPTISGKITLSENMVTSDLTLTNNAQNAPPFIPNLVQLKGSYHTKDSHLTVQGLDINAPHYSLVSNIAAVFRQGENITLKGLLKTQQVEELSPISFEVSIENKENPFAHVDIGAIYKDKPLKLQSDVFAKGESADFRNTKINLPDLSITGDVALNTKTSLATGKLSGRLEKLAAYHILIGARHSVDPLNFAVTLNPENGAQNLVFNASTPQYSHKDSGLTLNNMLVKGKLYQERLTISSFAAEDKKGGTLKASGHVDTKTMAIDGNIKVDNLHAIKGEMASGIINMDIDVKGQGNAYKVSGTIKPKRMDIKLPERFSAQIPHLNIVAQKKGETLAQRNIVQDVMLDVIFDAPNQIFVRGWGLDAEFGGKLKIAGMLDDAQFDGNLNLLRGRYSEFGKNFKLPRGKLAFNGSIPPSPTLDILATTKADEVTAQIEITGTAEKPKIGFSSVPTLPEDEVLSRILFGKSASSISPFQAVQLAQALQRLSGNGGGASGFDPLGVLRSATGLDDIRVETDEEGGASVGAGKYLSEKVYLEFEAGSADNSGGATLEIEVSPNITVESEIGQDARGGAGIFWKHDY